MAENVFKESKEYLVSARGEVIERDNMSAEIASLKASLKKINKNIASEERSISDEIESTIKKRRQQVEDTYDDRLDDNRDRKKKLMSKRDKKKAQRMNARYEKETKHLRDAERDLDVELKTLLRKNHVPSCIGSRLYFIMFMPRGLSEIGFAILSFLIYFGGIPALAMLLIKKLVLETKDNINMAFWCVLVASVAVVIQLIIYFGILSATKLRHNNVLEQARSIIDKSKANKRQMSAIRNSINKDKDESKYNLGSYDDKLAELDSEADAIGQEKQEALRNFDDNTVSAITDEINDRRLQILQDMKAQKAETEERIAVVEKQYSDKVLQITNKYASYLGEELCREDKLADLIALIEDEQAETVSEAISVYKGQKSSR